MSQVLSDLDSIVDWFKQSRPFPYFSQAQSLMQQLLPSINFLSWDIKPCIVTYTPSWKPMVDCIVDGRVYVAAGGNGGAAHPSDAIGKIAADFMVHNAWQATIDARNFKASFADEHIDWMRELTSVWMS